MRYLLTVALVFLASLAGADDLTCKQLSTCGVTVGGVITTTQTFSPDDTIDIGQVGAVRPRTGYFGTSVVAGVASLSSQNLTLYSGAYWEFAGGQMHVMTDGYPSEFGVDTTDVRTKSGSRYCWAGSSTDAGQASDTCLVRSTAGVVAVSDTTNSVALLGGGAAVASATAMPLPTGRVFHVTGTTSITSITSTNLGSGVCITIIFDGILTFTDGNNLKLLSNFVTTADDTISLCYDGTNWYETSRSIN